ncbi:MAG: hypothetical protein PHO37_10850 [Kiritimatiellae bacterium]|nr:hypothetical protein [Kiritimatiellia bacterium]
MKTQLCLLFQMLLITTCAWGFTGGNGSEGSPWQITNRLELEAVNNDLTAHYILMNNIDLGATNYTDAVIAGWTGSALDSFMGVFDGNYKTISNLTIDGGTTNGHLGLFGSVQYGGSVKKLKLEGCNISGSFAIGMLAGNLWEQALVSDCYAIGTVSGENSIGGLIGVCREGVIANCYAAGCVSGISKANALLGEEHYYASIRCCF